MTSEDFVRARQIAPGQDSPKWRLLIVMKENRYDLGNSARGRGDGDERKKNHRAPKYAMKSFPGLHICGYVLTKENLSAF
jgi:hypothetical protein